MLHRLTNILVTLCIAGIASVAQAFPRPYDAIGDITPWVPGPQDHVVLSISDTIDGVSPSLHIRPQSLEITRQGNVIRVTATLVDDPQTAPSTYFHIDLGTLPVGRYTVNYGSTGDGPGGHGVSIGFSVSTDGYATAVEYFSPTLRHYFMTSASDEQALLDQGVTAGWMRTGESFHVIPTATQPTTALSVCRFYGLPQAGLDSHFFTALPDECEAVQRQWPNSWFLETADAFATVFTPELQGGCPTGSVTVYRLYNNRPDANHRYTTSRQVRDQMIALGWTLEGTGQYPELNSMCVPD